MYLVKITFDGDTLNLILLINNDLKLATNNVFNPRNAMFISRNDGNMETFFNLKDDAVILINAFLSMTNDKYTQEDIDEIEACKNWHMN